MPLTDITRRPRLRSRPARRGTATIGLLLLIGFLLLLTALVLHLRLISCAHQQLQATCDASALAAAAAFMEAGPPPPLWSTEDVVKNGARSSEHSLARQVRVARQQAAQYATRNPVLGRQVSMEARRRDAPPDITFGWVGSVDAGPGEVNSVGVRAGHSQHCSPLTSWFGRALAVAPLDVWADAVATVDQQLYGFRPAGHVRAPLVPLVAVSTQTARPGSSAGPPPGDRCFVDLRTGQVREGGDGIPELTLIIGEPGASTRSGPQSWGTAHPISLGTAQPGRGSLLTQIRFGLTATDLVEQGGEFALGRDGRMSVVGPGSIAAHEIDALRLALLAIRGERRVWPLGMDASQSIDKGRKVWAVTHFAAGQLIDCRRDSETTLLVTLQPCWLQSCTALVRAGEQRNPWVGKLQLTR